MTDIRTLARGRWRSILSSLGVDSKLLSGDHGPCPMCGGRDRFRYTNRNNDGMYYCNNCGSGDGFKLLMEVNKWDFHNTAKEVESIVGSVKVEKQRQKMSDERRLEIMRDLFARSEPVYIESEAGKYLDGRGLLRRLDCLNDNALRSVSEYKHKDGSITSAMVGYVSDVDGNTINAQRTFIRDGKKAGLKVDKKCLPGSIPPGSAIRLAPDACGVIGIAEGVETALACYDIFDIPTWAVMGADGMQKFVLPNDVKIDKLVIFADNDESYVGQLSAYSLARRLHEWARRADKKLTIEVEIPNSIGDFAD